MYKKSTSIPEEFELNNKGRPVNSNGKRLKINNTGIVVYKNGKPVYENENENNFQLPKRIKQTILQHPKSKHSYIIIKNKNKNGIEIEKFVKVNKEQIPIKDGDNYIYLNKENIDILFLPKKIIIILLEKDYCIFLYSSS
jgi:flagellar basal body rod protein FlgG